MPVFLSTSAQHKRRCATLYESIPSPYYSAFAKYTPYGASRDASSSKILVLFQENPMAWICRVDWCT